MSGFEFIKYEIREKTSVITFNRPDCYNAMNRSMKLEIIKAIKTANKDENIASIILTGEGKAFSSGQDLNDRTVKSSEGPVDLGHTLETEWNPLCNTIRESQKLVLAAINGVTAGAGLSVALSCDLITAKPGIKYVSGFAQIGLAPDAGSSHLLTRTLGKKKALEFFLFGSPLISEDLLQYGLINKISDDPLKSCIEWAKNLATLAPLSVREIKRNCNLAEDASRSKVMERETAIQRYLGWSEDYKEGVGAFLEKRKPQFQGR